MGTSLNRPAAAIRWSYAGRFCLALVLLAGTYAAGLMLTGNFHEVIPGQLYRSAQPSGADLEDYTRRFGIKTVINLRGSNSSPWYAEEVAAAKQHGLVHIDFKMSASRLLTPERSLALIDLMRDAPKPILIHCKSGADRTGLASVLYFNQIAGRDEQTSERQLSIAFGHVSVPLLSSAFAMDQSWEAFKAVLKEEAITRTLQRSPQSRPKPRSTEADIGLGS